MQSKKKSMYNYIYKFGRTGVSIFKIVYSGSNITTNQYQFVDTKLPLLNNRNVSIRENANRRIKIVDRETENVDIWIETGCYQGRDNDQVCSSVLRGADPV
jgi:hypothetical protein